MALPPVLSSIIGWLRAGYPEGVPDVDYIPLFALLGSQLTDDRGQGHRGRTGQREQAGVGGCDP